MTKLFNSKTHICTFLLCVILISEMTILGNAFVFYSNLPRYFIFFICTGLAFLVAYPFKLKNFSHSGIILGIIAVIALISDFFFSLEHQLYVVKMLAIIAIAHICINDYELLRRRLGQTFLHLSNLGILLGLSSFILPESLSFNTGYIDELRRQGEGFGGTFYWSQNFSGLFLIGDEPNPLPFLSDIPRYAGYTHEPAINGFILCLSIALLFDSSYKFTFPVIALTTINFLITFSVAGFSIFLVLYIFRLLIKSNMLSSLFIITNIFIVGVIATPLILGTEYLQLKLGNSLGASIDIWEAIALSNPLYLSSLNARVGDFAINNINMISAILWMSLLGYIMILFVIRLFSQNNSKISNVALFSERPNDLWIIVLIGFSIKSLSHYIFMPIFFVLIAELMLMNRQNSLKNFQ